MADRRIGRSRSKAGGFALLSLLVILTMGTLYFFVDQLTPALVEAIRQKRTEAAMAEARNALLGYALTYRETQAAKDADSSDSDDRIMYGYLPLPDLGSSRNNNQLTDTTCYGMEGCEAYNFSGNGTNVTVIGRFPWRTLGTGPLRDGHGECLWYAVSGSHQRNQPSSPMNWDTLGHIDIVAVNSLGALASTLASSHDRPIAVIFSPGPTLDGQDRSTYGSTDNVTECGGNYNAKNYLDPGSVALGAISNYFPNTTPQYASGTTSTATPKSLSIQGKVYSDGALLYRACPGGSTSCNTAANDQGLALTSKDFYDKLRKGVAFRTDINSMLERMVGCLRDKLAAGTGFTPDAITGFVSPTDKTNGRVPSDTCYDDDQNPLGYFSHYQDQIFVATPNSTAFTVDGASCGGVLIFPGQRGTKSPLPTDAGESQTQLRNADTVSVSNPKLNTDWPANYLEDPTLAFFKDTGTALTGTQTSYGAQTGSQDVVRCIPSTASLTEVESPNLTPAQQLVDYDAANRTLTLGKAGVVNSVAGAGNLFGCAWFAEATHLDGGFRSYFKFSFATVGTSVGNTGFVFAVIDAESNPGLPCGMAGNHLGYSGDNGLTSKIASPKIGIEFDQSRNSGFPGSSGESSTNAGRNDPCGTSSCGASPVVGYNSHAAIVYWGHEATNATNSVTRPDNDDNVHGLPTAGSLASTRKPPTNPSTAPGIEFVNLRTGGDIFHVRVEVTPTRIADTAAAENSRTSLETKVWILADSTTVANQIAAMKNTTRSMSQLLSTSFQGTLLSDTASIYDVAGSACVSGTCATGQACGSDNICYRQGLNTVRAGFTGSQRTQDQSVTITDIFTTWLQ